MGRVDKLAQTHTRTPCSESKAAYGYFAADRFGSKDRREYNRRDRVRRTFTDAAMSKIGALAHEMTYLKQHHPGGPSWAGKLAEGTCDALRYETTSHRRFCLPRI